MIVVVDTGPLLHLYEAQCLELLKLTGEVHIPSIISTEISYLLPNLKIPDWITIAQVTGSYKSQAISWRLAGILDDGEAEALALSQQLDARWFITDDAAARLLGKTIGIEVHGSLGVVLWAAAVGYLNQVQAFSNLENLIRTSIWISPKIISKARRALKSIYGKS